MLNRHFADVRLLLFPIELLYVILPASVQVYGVGVDQGRGRERIDLAQDPWGSGLVDYHHVVDGACAKVHVLRRVVVGDRPVPCSAQLVQHADTGEVVEHRVGGAHAEPLALLER